MIDAGLVIFRAYVFPKLNKEAQSQIIVDAGKCSPIHVFIFQRREFESIEEKSDIVIYPMRMSQPGVPLKSIFYDFKNKLMDIILDEGQYKKPLICIVSRSNIDLCGYIIIKWIMEELSIKYEDAYRMFITEYPKGINKQKYINSLYQENAAMSASFALSEPVIAAPENTNTQIAISNDSPKPIKKNAAISKLISNTVVPTVKPIISINPITKPPKIPRIPSMPPKIPSLPSRDKPFPIRSISEEVKRPVFTAKSPNRSFEEATALVTNPLDSNEPRKSEDDSSVPTISRNSNSEEDKPFNLQSFFGRKSFRPEENLVPESNWSEPKAKQSKKVSFDKIGESLDIREMGAVVAHINISLANYQTKLPFTKMTHLTEDNVGELMRIDNLGILARPAGVRAFVHCYEGKTYIINKANDVRRISCNVSPSVSATLEGILTCADSKVCFVVSNVLEINGSDTRNKKIIERLDIGLIIQPNHYGNADVELLTSHIYSLSDLDNLLKHEEFIPYQYNSLILVDLNNKSSSVFDWQETSESFCMMMRVNQSTMRCEGLAARGASFIKVVDLGAAKPDIMRLDGKPVEVVYVDSMQGWKIIDKCELPVTSRSDFKQLCPDGKPFICSSRLLQLFS